MPVFISYSHADSEFVTNLALQLVKHKANIWIDQWDIRVGDSLIKKVAEAIEGASALLVILSKASVESEWCKKELTAGLMRELDEKRVVVLPVVIEDCTIPLFLRDKFHADFRKSFDAGLRRILESIARITSDSLARVDSPHGHIDWSTETGFVDDDGTFFMQMTGVEHYREQPYTVLTMITILGNDFASARCRAISEAGLAWIQHGAIIGMIVSDLTEKNIQLLLTDAKRAMTSMEIRDSRTPSLYHVSISSQRMGQDTGMDTVVTVGGQLIPLREHLKSAQRNPTSDELRSFREIQLGFEQAARESR